MIRHISYVLSITCVGSDIAFTIRLTICPRFVQNVPELLRGSVILATS